MCVLAVLLATAALGYYLSRPLPLPNTPFEFSLRQGSSLTSMAHEMHQAGLLPQAQMFIWLVRLLGKDQQIKAGSYTLTQAVTPLELLHILQQGQVSQCRISLIEGWTFRQFRATLDATADILHDSSGLSNDEILRRIGATENHAEGLFFPDTYHFDAGSSDMEILKRAYQTMQQYLLKEWLLRDKDLPLSDPYQALILASIVEKETGVHSDRSIIAGVFVNRLRKGMALQTDPSVIYGLGERFDGNLRKRDLLADTPYNTYTRPGLPPTPIALPGAASLQAALHPAQTDALYFVARGDGSSHFSKTLTEHNRAVNRYQK
ncbi:MAG: endolytic transglycosylase MltG [Pseudomonadota bacterium]